MNNKAHARWVNEVQNYNVEHLRLRLVADLINEMKPSAYVDLGCAGGLLGTLTPESKYIGVDFVRPNIAPTFEFHQCDLNNDELPAALGGVDAVSCSGILEYVSDLPEFFGKLRGVVRPGTTVIATYFNMNHVSRVWDLLSGRTFNVHPDWRNFLAPREFQMMVSKAGFSVKRVIPVGVSIGVSPSVQNAVVEKARIPKNFKGSYLFSHQFIFVLSA